MRLLPRLLDDGLSDNFKWNIECLCFFRFVSLLFLFLTFPPSFVPRSAISRLGPPLTASVRLWPPWSALGCLGPPSAASVRPRSPQSALGHLGPPSVISVRLSLPQPPRSSIRHPPFAIMLWTIIHLREPRLFWSYHLNNGCNRCNISYNQLFKPHIWLTT